MTQIFFMRTKFYTCCILLIVAFGSNGKVAAQTGNVGIGTISPEPSAVLDITSTTQGVLLPRMTMEQRNAIVAPAAGLLIYQYDVAPGFYYYLSGWQPLGSSSTESANRLLSNLQAPTAINTNLLPGNSGLNDIGSPSLLWRDIHFNGDIFLQGARFISSRGTNNFFGTLAGNTSTTGFYNTASGSYALSGNINGYWNTAYGYQALSTANNSYGNTGTGFQSLISNTTGNYNTATGVLALSSVTAGNSNTATGAGAVNLASGSYNSAFGYFSGGNLPVGDYNTYLGAYADGPEAATLFNATAVGYEATVSASNSVKVGNTSVTSIGGYAGWTTYPSDRRFKTNIKEDVPGLQFINQLRAVTYNVDVDALNKALRPPLSGAKTPDALGRKKEITADEIGARLQKTSVTYTGFIAQEVEAAAKKIGYRFSGVDAPKSSKDFYGLRYSEFVVPLVKSVQELARKVEDLQREKALLKNKNEAVENTIKKQQAQIDSQQQQIESLKAMVLQMQKGFNPIKPAVK